MNLSTASGGNPGSARIGNCAVCEVEAAGYHFGAFTCEGCKSFYGRTYRRAESVEPCRGKGACNIIGSNRTSCKWCRLQKCYEVGMSRDRSRYGRRSASFNEQVLSGMRVGGGRDHHQPEVRHQQERQPPLWQVPGPNDRTQRHLDRHSQTQTMTGGGGAEEQFGHKVVVEWPTTPHTHPGQDPTSGAAHSHFRYAGEAFSEAAQLRETFGDEGHLSDSRRPAMLHVNTGRRWSVSTSHGPVPMEMGAAAAMAFSPSEVEEMYKSLLPMATFGEGDAPPHPPANHLLPPGNALFPSGSSRLPPESASLRPASAPFPPATASFPPESVSRSQRSLSVSPADLLHGESPPPTCPTVLRHWMHAPLKWRLKLFQQLQRLRHPKPGEEEPAPLDLSQVVAPDPDQPLNLSHRK